MNDSKRNWGIGLVLGLLIAVPAAAQELGNSSLKDELNRRLDDVTFEHEMTPEEEAVVHYQQGVALVQRAIQQEQKANENEGAKREKLMNKVDKTYENAVREFAFATERNPNLLEAWSGLGWVNRRLARWDDAVAAYDAALTVEPAFTAAIEGRAEAYLALNRVDDVRSAYEHLMKADEKNARQLLGAVENWVRERHTAGQADSAEVREMMAFVVEQREAS